MPERKLESGILHRVEVVHFMVLTHLLAGGFEPTITEHLISPIWVTTPLVLSQATLQSEPDG
jgi:hypothetical protein